MSQAKPRQYLGALCAALAAAKAANASRAAAYHVLPQGISCKADWAGWSDPWYNATPRQQALLDVLQDLLDGGETGYFFDDVLHALYALDAQDTEQVFYGLIDRLMQPDCVRAGLIAR